MMATLDQVELRGEMLYDEPMSRHTSWRVGGPARRYYRPADADDLIAFLRDLPGDEPLLWLGLGSNLLVRDGGIKGTVLATQGRLAVLQRTTEQEIRAEAGVSCAKLARYAVREGMRGIEFLAGIPGTVGGALAMNAGAHGDETWKHVIKVETVDRAGQLRLRPPEDFQVGYRHVLVPRGEWFVAASLRLIPGDAGEGQQEIRALLDRRNASQPTSEANSGSVFRNPPGDHAGRLIEAAGLKGLCVGGACVSEKHANFIINKDAASAADIEALIHRLIDAVAEKHGVWLVPEVRIVGEAA